jgi:hypothetical protein
VGDIVGTGQLRGLQPAAVEQQTPTVLLPVLAGNELVVSRPMETLADLDTLPAVLSPMPGGRWWCNHCGAIGAEGIMRRAHRVVPVRRRWWHRVLRIQPGWSRCQQQT